MRKGWVYNKWGSAHDKNSGFFAEFLILVFIEFLPCPSSWKQNKNILDQLKIPKTIKSSKSSYTQRDLRIAKNSILQLWSNPELSTPNQNIF